MVLNFDTPISYSYSVFTSGEQEITVTWRTKGGNTGKLKELPGYLTHYLDVKNGMK